jgi:hypothetical protein
MGNGIFRCVEVVDHQCCWCYHCFKVGFTIFNRFQAGGLVGNNIVERSLRLVAVAERNRQQAAVAIAAAAAARADMLLYAQGLLCWGWAEQVMHAGALGFKVALGQDMQACSNAWVRESETLTMQNASKSTQALSLYILTLTLC